jgi:hypothetical protein
MSAPDYSQPEWDFFFGRLRVRAVDGAEQPIQAEAGRAGKLEFSYGLTIGAAERLLLELAGALSAHGRNPVELLQRWAEWEAEKLRLAGSAPAAPPEARAKPAGDLFASRRGAGHGR